MKPSRSKEQYRVKSFVVTGFFVVSQALFLSFLFHLFLILRLPSESIGKDKIRKKDYVKMSISRNKLKDSVPEKIKTPKDKKLKVKKILEVHQEETLAPKDAKFLGQVNHKAKKESKLKENLRSKNKAQDPKKKKLIKTKKAKKKSKKIINKINTEKTTKQVERKKKISRSLSPFIIEKTKVTEVKEEISESSRFAALLESQSNFLNNEIDQGYQDYIEDQIDEGEVIDISTQEYRFVGYFTSLRKAIELVWVYPLQAARKGHFGKVRLKFTILKNGRVVGVEVRESSGYQILDESIVSAIKLASPFAPLPESMDKDQMTVTGSFTYLLHNYFRD